MSITRITATLVSSLACGAGSLSLAAPAHATGPDDPTGGEVTTTLRARKAPSTSASLTHTYRPRTSIKIACKVKGTSVKGTRTWYAVAGHPDRWVSAAYVDTLDVGPHYCDPLDGYVTGKTTAALTARQGPTTRDTASGRYAKGATVKIQCKVTSQSVKGNALWYHTSKGTWVSARYVKNVGMIPRFCSAG